MTDDQYAYQDPTVMAWTAQMFRTARRRRMQRLAVEAARTERDGQGDDADDDAA